MLADVYFNIHYRPGCDGAATPFINQKDSQSQSLPDVMIQRIPAHAFILAISSAVFEAMFYGPLSVGRSAMTANAGESGTKESGQTVPKQTSWPSSSSCNSFPPSQRMHVDSVDDINSLGTTEKSPRSHHFIFNPSSSQITPNNPMGEFKC